ncbi:MAG: succinate dehydrogenase assembly factor 2 [Pseudomonadota bacterium]
MPRPMSLDNRRRRAKFRAWHRGMKEMDIILGGYVEAKVSDMEHAQLDDLEIMMEILDRDLFKWFTGEAPVPAEHDNVLFKDICDFHGIVLADAK